MVMLPFADISGFLYVPFFSFHFFYDDFFPIAINTDDSDENMTSVCVCVSLCDFTWFALIFSGFYMLLLVFIGIVIILFIFGSSFC